VRVISVTASTPQVAGELYSVLSDLRPEIIEHDEGWEVSVEVVGGDAMVTDLLSRLQKYVEGRNGSAQLEMDGRQYTMKSS
jgi:hypothetical protein